MYKSLYSAVLSGNMDKVEQMSNCMGIDFSYHKVYDLISLAINKQDTVIAKILLKAFKMKNKCQNTINDVLKFAFMKRNKEMIKFLLENGMDINYIDYSGKSLLYKGIPYSNTELTELFLNHGAYIDVREHCDERQNYYKNCSPLIFAVNKGSYTLVTLLLSIGADVHAQNNCGETPLHIAANNGFVNIVKILLEYNANVSNSDCIGRTPLHFTILNKNADPDIQVEIAKLLLDKGANVDAQSQYHEIPLHTAVQNGCVNMVKILLEYNANASISDYIGRTALHLIPINENTDPDIQEEIAKLLLNKGANIDAQTESGETPLHFAAQNGCVNILKIFLEYNANDSISDHMEGTALHFTVMNKKTDPDIQIEIAKLLLSEGANVDAESQYHEIPLHTAVQNGCVNMVKILLEYNANVSISDCIGRTALHFTTINENIDAEIQEEIAKLLINKGANVDALTHYSETPLHFAVQNACVNMVKILLKNNANVCISDCIGRTALHFTVVNKNADPYIQVEIAKLLLNKGANIDAQSQYHEIPLHTAVQNGCINMVKILLEYNANVSISDYIGRTALHFIAINENTDPDIQEEIAKLLLNKGANVDAPTHYSETPLHFAAQNGCVNMVKILLENNANVYISDCIGKSSLHFAVFNKNADPYIQIEIAKLLLSKGVQVDAQTKSGETPLHFAAQNGCVNILKILLEYNANDSISDCIGRTALHFTSINDNTDPDIQEEIAKLLLNKGADVDAQTKNGETPLHFAAQNGYVNILKILLEYNANNSISDCTGRTALHFTSINDNTDPDIQEEIAKLLLNKGADVDAQTKNGETPLHFCVQNGCVNIMKILLEYNADTNISDKRGRTALHFTVLNKNTDPDIQEEIAKLFLNKGANVDAQTESGETPLHFAAQNGCVNILKILLEYNANVSISDYVGRTALHFIAVNENTDPDIQEEIAKLLLNTGANVDAQTKSGETLLHIAVQNGCVNIVKILLEYNADTNISDERGRTALHFTINNEKTDPKIQIVIVKLLLNTGANIDAQSQYYEIPLCTADYSGGVNVVQGLGKSNRNVNKLTKFFFCPTKFKTQFELLSSSVQKIDKEISMTFFHKKADVNAKQKQGITALHIAIKKCNIEVAKLLLERGANVNSQTNDGNTALHFAVQFSYSILIEIMLQYGADINIINAYGDTPVTVRSSMLGEKYDEIYRKLLHYVIKLKTANLYVCEKNLGIMHHCRCEFKNNCNEELIRIKSDVINNTNISFYDIFVKNTSSLERCMRNENIIKILKSNDYKIKFPIYASIIECHFRIGMKRNELLKQFYEILVNNFSQLPYNCFEEICSYLNNSDLKNVITALIVV